MRIGIDMLGAQSPVSRGRGIGRYARGLTSALARCPNVCELLLYAHDGFSTAQFPTGANVTARLLPAGATPRSAIQRLVQINPDDVDIFLLLSPFDLDLAYDPPAVPVRGPALASVIYDLILFRFQEQCLRDVPVAARFYRALERLRRFDLLLAISEATAEDVRSLLGLGPDRCCSIGGASDPEFFTPAPGGEVPAEVRRWLQRRGATQPFLFCVASPDDRKNLAGLLDACALLPEGLRDQHQVVVSCALKADEIERARRLASERGLGRQLVLTGEVTDEELRWLYRSCEAFVFPSKAEGLGLPLLEAMLCGAAVLAGNNSAQPEIVGTAGLLANASDPADIAARIEQLLTDRQLASRLRDQARPRALQFQWDHVARRTLQAIEQCIGKSQSRKPHRRSSDSRPILAIASPWPPQPSGVADHALQLAQALERHYRLELYHDPGRAPDRAGSRNESAGFDIRLLPRRMAALGHRGPLYQMGNSEYHEQVYKLMKMCPGVVTLHDLELAGFHAHLAAARGWGWDWFVSELEHAHPQQAAEIISQLPELVAAGANWNAWFAQRGLFLSRRVFDHAQAVVVHSRWCQRTAAAIWPEAEAKINVVPLGAASRPGAARRRDLVRSRLGLATTDLVIGSFGILAESKMNLEALRAFQALVATGRHPTAQFVFVGRDLSGGPVAAAAADLGLASRVRFVGHVTADEYLSWLDAVDLAFCLRRPPTNGETSAALLGLLSTGVPTIVIATDTFNEFPDEVVRMVAWTTHGQDALNTALIELADQPQRREALGAAALRYIERGHDWDQVADLYHEVLERAHREAALGRKQLARAV